MLDNDSFLNSSNVIVEVYSSLFSSYRVNDLLFASEKSNVLSPLYFLTSILYSMPLFLIEHKKRLALKVLMLLVKLINSIDVLPITANRLAISISIKLELSLLLMASRT